METSFVQILKRSVLASTTNKNTCTHGGTRTPNLRFRRPTPYPLGHAGTLVQKSRKTLRQPAQQTLRVKMHVRRPGIEPGSQEWESCMIPLHQRRLDIPLWKNRNPQIMKINFSQLCTTLDGLLHASLLVESSFCAHTAG